MLFRSGEEDNTSRLKVGVGAGELIFRIIRLVSGVTKEWLFMIDYSLRDKLGRFCLHLKISRCWIFLMLEFLERQLLLPPSSSTSHLKLVTIDNTLKFASWNDDPSLLYGQIENKFHLSQSSLAESDRYSSVYRWLEV